MKKYGFCKSYVALYERQVYVAKDREHMQANQIMPAFMHLIAVLISTATILSSGYLLAAGRYGAPGCFLGGGMLLDG